LAAHQPAAGVAGIAVAVAAAFAEAPAAAAVHPHRAAAAAEVATLHAAGAGDVLQQHRAAVERGAALAPLAVVAGADQGLAPPAGAVPAAIAAALQRVADVLSHL